MRKALNENPLVQVGVVGVLIVIVGLVFMINMGGGGSSAPPADTASTETETGPTPPPAGEPAPSPAPPAGEGSPSPAQVPVAIGPELPADVQQAYRANDVIVLLVNDSDGIEDRFVRQAVQSLSSDSALTTFVVPVEQIARYTRLTQGVNVTRVPAMVVVRPREQTGQIPSAQVYYGYRSAESIDQAVSDARFDGPTDTYSPG